MEFIPTVVVKAASLQDEWTWVLYPVFGMEVIVGDDFKNNQNETITGPSL